ncbi:MAG: hypothetical protein CMQ19_12400 [Gammaproteobacteria bacterium]|nr:hypothetical protein [Gammaproteobacteria bacterium]
MRALAEFVMRGRSHAVGATLVSTSLPLLNWLGTAIVSLVILRKGPLEGLMVLMWALIPLGIALYLVGDPSPVIAMLGTALLACVLRVTASWEVTLAIAVLVSGAGSLVFELSATEVLAAIVEWYLEYSRQLATELHQTGEPTFGEAKSAIMGFFAMGQAYAMLAFLVLARWWQSELYNPGGFGKEFRQLRMSPLLSAVLVFMMLICFAFDEYLGRWIPLLTVPLIIPALAFIHWLIGSRKLSGNWVFGFYMLLAVMFQVVYPLLASLALMDSWFDLRTRFQSKEV